MDMDEALRRGAAGLAGQSLRILAMARAMSLSPASDAPPPRADSPGDGEASLVMAEAGDPQASRRALVTSHALLGEAIDLLASSRRR